MIYWFMFRPQTEGTACVVINEGRVLLLQHSYIKDAWGLPGGGLKKGELAEQAIIREVFEEAGIVIDEVSYLGDILNTAAYKKDTVHCYRTEVADSVVRVDGREIVAAGWFEINDLPEKMLSVSRHVLQKWLVN